MFRRAPGAATPATPVRHELLPAPRLLLLQRARRAGGVLRQPRRRGVAGVRQGADPGARASAARARCGSTRRAASTAAKKGRCSSSIRKRSGTPTSTAPTSTRSSTGTSFTARSSRGSAFDAEVDRARDDRRPGRRPRDRAERRRRRRPRGIALVAHPHPLQGGTLDNKVAQTLAKTFFALGYAAVRFNFRGVGQSQGTFDDGAGEAADALAALRFAQDALRRGTRAAGRACRILVRARTCRPSSRNRSTAERLVLVGPAVRRFAAAVPPDTIVIHGEEDDVVPLAEVLAWARPQALPVVVFPGCGHFFHGRLPQLQGTITGMWQSVEVAAVPDAAHLAARGWQETAIASEVVLRVAGLRKFYGEQRGRPRLVVRDPPRRVLRAAGPERRRQDDDAALLPRAHRSRRRHDRDGGRCRCRRRRAQARIRVGVVPQQDNLDPDFTVTENLQVYGRYFGIDPRDARRRASLRCSNSPASRSEARPACARSRAE